jgi:hypothetical protein
MAGQAGKREELQQLFVVAQHGHLGVIPEPKRKIKLIGHGSVRASVTIVLTSLA